MYAIGGGVLDCCVKCMVKSQNKWHKDMLSNAVMQIFDYFVLLQNPTTLDSYAKTGYFIRYAQNTYHHKKGLYPQP